MCDRQQQTLYRLEMLRAIAEHLNRISDLQPMLDTALGLILDLMGLHTGWIALLDEEGCFYCAAAQGLPLALEAEDRAALRWSPCQCQRMLLAGELTQAVNIVECERLGRVRQALQGQEPELAHRKLGGLRYQASIPLQAGNRVMGMMNVARAGKEPLGEQELTLLSLVGETLGAAIHRAQLYEGAKQSARLR